jgi:hypothetical protein
MCVVDDGHRLTCAGCGPGLGDTEVQRASVSRAPLQRHEACGAHDERRAAPPSCNHECSQVEGGVHTYQSDSRVAGLFDLEPDAARTAGGLLADHQLQEGRRREMGWHAAKEERARRLGIGVSVGQCGLGYTWQAGRTLRGESGRCCSCGGRSTAAESRAAKHSQRQRQHHAHHGMPRTCRWYHPSAHAARAALLLCRRLRYRP